jgi:hypothetical protein
MFDHLILLIGTNPLPNFVVAEHFLEINSNLKDIYLVYSEEKGNQRGTSAEAINLHKLLSERHTSIQLHEIPLSDVSNASEICRDIRDRLIEKLPPKCGVHVNYTGGTKAMSIHIYRAIEQESKRIMEKSFSYLDARHFCIIDDENNVTKDLRQEVCLEFKELITLHGFHRKEEKDRGHDFSQVLAVFCRLIEEGRLHEYFKIYKRDVFLKKDKEHLIEAKSHISDELRDFKAKGAFLAVVSALPDAYRLFDKKGNFTELPTISQLKSAVKFLDGTWLEEYVYQSLKKAFKGSNISIDKNWKIKKSGWTADFELDVVLMNGYQLIGISCTTSGQKSICKSKGFEIIHRTQQIGGEEAKAVVITRLEHDRKAALQDELGIDTGGKTNILVLGMEDLKEDRLIREIKDFIGNE